ncbi:MAG: PAS domain S-box protein, partial [Planctomycetaceae bacterium]
MVDGRRDGARPPAGTPRHKGDVIEAVLDVVRALVVVLDPAGRIVRLNRACEQATGYLFEEVQGRPFWDFLVLPEEAEAVQAEFVRLQASQVRPTLESQLLAKDGSRRWIAWSNMALAGDGDSVEYVIGTGIDITEHRRAEEELQRALDESRQHQAEVSALLDGARQVLARRPFEETAHSLFDTCRALTGATAGYVALSSQDGTQNELLFHDCGGRPCFMSEALPTPLRGLGEQVRRTGSVAYDNDLRSGPWASSLPEGHAAVENMLCAPLVIGGRVVGLFGLANKAGGFRENDARLAMAFAEMVAIALHNSRLLNTLEAGEQRFRSVVETASAAIVTTDGRGLITFWNQKAESIFGYTAQEVIGLPLTLVFPERYRDSHHEGMYRLLPTGSTRLSGETVETIGARKGGDEFPLEISLATWKTGEGTFFTVLMQDITQCKQLEGALGEARQSIEALIEASPLAILAVDLDVNVRLWNPAAERIFGWSEGEVLGHPNPLISETGQGESQNFIAQALAGQEVSGRESVRHKKDGSPIVVSTWTAPLYDAEGSVRNVMTIIADVTLRRRNEEALRRYAHEQSALYTVTAAVA